MRPVLMHNTFSLALVPDSTTPATLGNWYRHGLSLNIKLPDLVWPCRTQPIMRRRQWTVPLLTEFFPPAHNLLGLNVGGGGGKTMEVSISTAGVWGSG